MKSNSSTAASLVLNVDNWSKSGSLTSKLPPPVVELPESLGPMTFEQLPVAMIIPSGIKMLELLASNEPIWSRSPE